MMWTEIRRRKIIKENKIKKEAKNADVELEEMMMICLAAMAKVSKREEVGWGRTNKEGKGMQMQMLMVKVKYLQQVRGEKVR